MAVYSICGSRSVCYLWLTLLLCFSDLQLTVIVVCNLKLIVNPIAVSLLFTFTLSDHTKSLLSSQSASHTFFVCIAHSFLYLHYLPPFRSSPLRHSQYDVLPGDRILYLLWVHKGSAITSAEAHETGVRESLEGNESGRKKKWWTEWRVLWWACGLILVGLIAFI